MTKNFAWSGKRVKIKPNWNGEGIEGLALGEPVLVQQLWLPVLFDGEEDPTFHKLAGVEIVK